MGVWCGATIRVYGWLRGGAEDFHVLKCPVGRAWQVLANTAGMFSMWLLTSRSRRCSHQQEWSANEREEKLAVKKRELDKRMARLQVLEERRAQMAKFVQMGEKCQTHDETIITLSERTSLRMV